jgi:pentatricopeptide repeat protein
VASCPSLSVQLFDISKLCVCCCVCIYLYNSPYRWAGPGSINFNLKFVVVHEYDMMLSVRLMRARGYCVSACAGAVRRLASLPLEHIKNREHKQHGAASTVIQRASRKRAWKQVVMTVHRAQQTSQPDVSLHAEAVKAYAKCKLWSQAACYLQRIPAEQQQPDVSLFTSIISGCSRAHQPQHALNLWLHMRQRNIIPNEKCFTSVMSAYGQLQQWEEAVALLQEMRLSSVEPTVSSYTAAIKACAAAAQFEAADELLTEMLALQMVPTVITYTAVITACAKSGAWQRALQLLADMRSAGVSPNSFTYSAVMSACTKGGAWQHSLERFADALQFVQPDVILYSAALTSCRAGEQWERAVQLLDQMQQQHELAPTAACYSVVIDTLHAAAQQHAADAVCAEALDRQLLTVWSAKDAGRVDLHAMTCSVAVTALRLVLRNLAETTATAGATSSSGTGSATAVDTSSSSSSSSSNDRRLASSVRNTHTIGVNSTKHGSIIRSSKSSSAKNWRMHVHTAHSDLYIITGHGSRRPVYGTSKLQPAVLAVLQQLGIECIRHSTNSGLLVVPARSLQQYLHKHAARIAAE